MNVIIYDHYKDKKYVNWMANDYMELSYSSEIPGGMLKAGFIVPEEYRMPYQWADVFNQVEIYNGPNLVWSGLVFAVERYWDSEESGIKVDCVGNAARLAWWSTNANLSNEKGSTWMTDHMLVHEAFSEFISNSSIDTTDYTIPGTRKYQPRKHYREALDDIQSYNQDTHQWYVWGDKFYWETIPETVEYRTTTEYCAGSIRQELTEFSNYIRYSYRTTSGTNGTGYEADSNTAYPNKVLIEAYSDEMGSAEAETRAEASLETHKVLGATAEITVSKVWSSRGEIPVCEIKPGKLIHISGLVTAKASPSEVFADNDVDTFLIKSATFDHNSQTMTIAPGRLPYTLPRVMARG